MEENSGICTDTDIRTHPMRVLFLPARKKKTQPKGLIRWRKSSVASLPVTKYRVKDINIYMVLIQLFFFLIQFLILVLSYYYYYLIKGRFIYEYTKHTDITHLFTRTPIPSTYFFPITLCCEMCYEFRTQRPNTHIFCFTKKIT